MKNRVFRIAAVVIALFAVSLLTLHAGDDPVRSLSKLSNNGNWAELRKEATEVLDKMDPDDVRAGAVWEKLREGILRGNEIAAYDAQFEKYIGGKFRENLRCFDLDHLDCVPDSGVMISGEFRRGPNRGNAGRYVTTGDRDRVRIIQLMSALIPKALEEKDSELRGHFFFRLAQVLLSGRRSGNSYKLQALTDFSRLPEYGESEGRTESISRPPVNADGSPVLYHVPSSWDIAASDGERYRFALDAAIRAGSREAKKAWADFLCGQFDFLTAGFSFRQEYYQAPAMREFLYTLGEDETIADLADGVRRIRLPEEFQYIKLYKELKEYDRLGSIYLSRMQFERAAEALEKAGGNRELCKQIRGYYGVPQSLCVQPAGMTLKIPFHYRNAKKVHIALYRVRTEDAANLMLKNWANAQSDWRRRSLFNLPSVRVDAKEWNKVVEKTPEKMIVFDLDPLPHHWESEKFLDFGKMEPGAFIIRFTPMDDKGNKADYSQADSLVWISDSVLSVRQRPGKQADLFLNHPVTGAPIPDAELKIYSFYMKRGWSRKSSVIRTEQVMKRTDADGLAVVSASDFKMPPDSYVVARFIFAENVPGKRTFLSDLSFPSDNSTSFPRRRRTFFISDRPIYKPGDAVAVTGYMRTPTYGDKVDALSLDTVALHFMDPRGKKAFELTVPYDKETQSFTAEMKLSADALPGLWRVRAQYQPGKYLPGILSFRVEEYKKPEYKLEVTPPAEPVPSGEQIPVALSMSYYFGAPVAGAKVTYKVFREETARSYPFVFFWNWLYGRYYAICSTAYENRYIRNVNFGRAMILDAKGVTDSEGKLSFKIDTAADIAKFGEKNFRYTVEAQASDDSGRLVKGSGSVIAAVKPFTVSIYTPWGFARTGKVCHIRIAARTPDGRKVAGKGTLRIFRRALNAQGVPERTGKVLKSIDFVPDGEDVVYVPGEPGVYEMDAEVISEKGIRISESIPIHVVGEKQENGLFGELPLTIATDKPEYQPGDTAKILVSCNQADRTIYFIQKAEREKQIRRVTLKGYSGLFEIPIRKEDQPNLFVEVMCVSEGEMHTVRKQIVIPPEKKVLNLSAVPETTRVKPGVSVPMTITLTGLDGKPVSGAVTVAVYDKSLEALCPGSIPAIVPFFWSWTRHCTSYWLSNLNASCCGMYIPRDAMQRNLENSVSLPFTGGYEYGMRRRYSRAYECCEDGAAAGAAPVMEAASMAMNAAPRAEWAQNIKMKSAGMDRVAGSAGSDEPADAPADVVRTNFQDRAFWIGRTVLPESGKTRVSIPIPDNLTTWTVRAWAITRDARAGEAKTEIVVSKNLIARLELPRFMVRGDTVSAVAIVHNLTEKEAETEVVLTAPGLLDSPVRRKLTIAAGGQSSFEVPLTANGEPGERVLTLSARAGSESDALELKLPVLVKGIDKQLNNCGRLDPQKRKDVIRLTIPEARRPGSSAFALHVSPGAARNMVELLPYLASDDSDDVFSLVNRFLPALAAKKAVTRLGVEWSLAVPGKKTDRDPLYAEYMNRYGGKAAVPSFTAEDFDRIVSNSVRKVRKMVNSDGGWGWFGTYGEYSWSDTTAYVVDALLDLRDTPLHEPGDDKLIRGGVDWLYNWADERIVEIRRHCVEYVSNVDCLVVRTLARAGRPHKELMDLCYKHRVRDLSPWGYAMLALAYDKESEECAMLIRNLEQFLKKDAENGTAWLNIPSSCCFFWYGNESETLSAYLLLLLRNDPASPTASMIARYLTVNILNSPWRNSLRGIGAAVRALAEYTVVSGEGDPDFTLTVRIGKSVHTVSIDKKNMWENAGPVLFLPDASLKSGPLDVELEFSGRGAVYWNSMLNYFSLEDTFEPAGLEMRIRRHYYRLVQDEDASALLAGRGGSVQKARVLRYHKIPLKEGDVVKPGDLLEVELVSTAKNDYDYVVFEDAMPAGFEYENPVSGWMRTGFGAPIYAAYRERGARFYLRNMARGESNVFYRIRAQLKGRVTALPAKGYGIYAPELKCNGAGMILRTE